MNMSKKTMKTLDDESLRTELLRLMARSWCLGRIIIEHANASKTPTGGLELSEREELTIRMLDLFRDKVTQKTLCVVFGMSHSQAGQLVARLVKAGLLKEKTARGQPLALSPDGEKVAKD